MRSLLAFGLAFCLNFSASAQGILAHPYGGGDGTGVLTYGGSVVGGGGGFVGIGDLASIPTPVAYWGAHCYNNAYAGNVVDILTTGVIGGAGANTVKGTLTCSSGVLGLTAKNASAWTLAAAKALCVGSASGCYASTIYDQIGTSCSGACNLTPVGGATNGNEIIYSDGSTTCGSGSSFTTAGNWCVQTNAGGNSSTPEYDTPALGSGVSQPYAMMCVYDDINAASQAELLRTGTNNYGILNDLSNVANNLADYAGGTPQTVTANDNHMHLGIAQMNGAVSSSLSADAGTANTTSAGTSAIGTETFKMFNTSGSYYFGYFYECGVFKTTSIVSIIANINTNESAYWGGGI